MGSILDQLARDAETAIDAGYYDVKAQLHHTPISLKRAIVDCPCAPIITELKFASPLTGPIRENIGIANIVRAMEQGGAVAISVLTERVNFAGSTENLAAARRSTNRPLLMKDIIISDIQLNAASRLGADAVLLILSLFNEGYCEAPLDLMIRKAKKLGLEVLLEAHGEEEFLSALDSQADMIGVNNRNLRTMEVNLDTTIKLLSRHGSHGRLIVSESGIRSPDDVRVLRKHGVQAFLIGTEIMASTNIQARVKEFVSAYEPEKAQI